MAALATALSLPVSLWAAWRLAVREGVRRELLHGAVLLPLLLPPTVLGYYLLVLASRDSLVGRIWEALTGAPLLFSWQAAVGAAMLYTIPLMVWWFREALERVDPGTTRAARSLGAGEWRIFWRVSVPLARGGLLAALVLSLARALGDFAVTLMIAGQATGPVRTLSAAVYQAAQQGRGAQARALALAVSLLAIALLAFAGRLASRRSVA